MGLAAAGSAGARRTSTAVPRYTRVGNLPDAAVLANSPSFDAGQRAQMAALPEVTATYPFEIAFAMAVTKPAAFQVGQLIPTTTAAARMLAGPVVAGRSPDPARADEVIVDENARRQFGLGIGSTMVVAQAAPPGSLDGLPPGMVPRHVDLNYRVTLRVVGIAKSVAGDPSWVVSSGFYDKYGPRTAGFINAFATLRSGQNDLPRFASDMNRIAGHPVNVESTYDLFGIRKAKHITGVEREGLLLFALAVMIGGGVLVGQALVRAVTAGADDLPTWRAMGIDTATAVPGLVLPATITAGVAALTAVVTAIALSSRFPIGLARRYDLDVGTHADWAVLGGAAIVAVIGVLVLATVTALWRATRGTPTNTRASWTGRWLARTGLPPTLEIGSRLAVEPGRGRSAVPVRSALVGAIVGVIGVVGCLTFRAGLDSAVADPERSGVVWDFAVQSGEGPARPADIAKIGRDPAVAAVLEADWARSLIINGVATPTFGTRAAKAGIAFVVLSGHAPRSVDEIAFAPTTMRALHVHVGDEITAGRTARVRVVGAVLLPATSHTDYDQSAWMTHAGLYRALPANQQGPNDVEGYVLVRWHPGVDVAAAQHRIATLDTNRYESAPSTRPIAVIELGRLRTLPGSLAIFFGLLAAATVAHALVTTVRRRRHDFAVLRALGFERRQSRLAIAWQASLLALAGVIIGVPLGVLLGRRLWQTVTNSFPLVYAAPFALVAVLLAIPLALIAANLLAAGPAHAATRISPAHALRTE
jgi:hypothetical protein